MFFKELKHLYGAAIIFFYYFKWPILIGWPTLKLVLKYKDNWIIDTLWIICLLLVLKDIWALKKTIFKK